MAREPTRRDFLKLASTAAGGAVLAGCSGVSVDAPNSASTTAATDNSAVVLQGVASNASEQGASAARSVTAGGTVVPNLSASSSTSSSVSSVVAQLQGFLGARAVPNFALPPSIESPPQIKWTGLLSGGSQAAATSLPNGISIPVSNSVFSRALQARYGPNLPGNPTVGGYPCLVVARSYASGGVDRTVGSVILLRFKTDAPVVEIAGEVTDNAQTVQTLIVNGALTAPEILSAGRGLGGGDTGAIRIDFGSRQMRDIWIETALAAAYVRIDQYDTILSVDDGEEPQITVVGDSYQLANSNAFGNGGAIALEIGIRLGIRKVAVDAIGGTGYWDTNRGLGNFLDRVVGHGADGSQIYLVLGGLNDYGNATANGGISWPDPSVYEAAVASYFAQLRALNPNAVIVATAPFCPDPPMSDSSYVAWAGTNVSGLGDFLYKAQVQKNALRQIAAPWVYIDVLMGTGWVNSSGATGDVTDLQWFTGGTPGAGTTATYKPGNTTGGGGGGFGGIQSVTVLGGGAYQQAPDITVSGGSGTGLLLASRIDSSGSLVGVSVQAPGVGYTSGSGMPQITIDPTYEIAPATLSAALMVGINPDGQYPLPSFAPPGSAGKLNNVYEYITFDRTHPSPLGVSYLAQRLAANIYAAVLAL